MLTRLLVLLAVLICGVGIAAGFFGGFLLSPITYGLLNRNPFAFADWCCDLIDRLLRWSNGSA